MKNIFMLDLSELRINQLRLIHSKKFRGLGFIKARNTHDESEDLRLERDVITDYLIENSEIDYTFYQMFLGLSFGMLGILGMCVLFSFSQLSITLPILGISVLFYFLSKKKKSDFILGEMGIEMSESFFNLKIKEKFNL